jgi:chromosome segregation ATPase
MRRADRQNSNYDNAVRYPQSKKVEPTSTQELKQRLVTVQSQRDELKQEKEKTATQLVEVQQQFTFVRDDLKKKEELYHEEQQKHQVTISLYNDEKEKAIVFIAKYEEADRDREKYLTLYNQTKNELKSERRSKAGIKSWETRRKQENERLKQEIGEMALLLQDSLARKDEAVNSLYMLAERMDRIQDLVDSVEELPSKTPIGFMKKMQRIFTAIKGILGEE